MALGRKTGGRQKGVKNRTTLERQRAFRNAALIADKGGFEAFAGDALTLLTSVYKDPNIPLDIRIDAAKTAVRYERAPLAPVVPPSNPENEAAKAQRLHALLNEMKRTVGGDDIG